MINLPHQINDVEKFHGALQVFIDLSARNVDLDDDGVVGLAMARARVYAFRDKAISLRAALRAEVAKPRGSQGTRTFARDLRRFFLLVGFLERGLSGELRVTATGRYLLGFEPESPESKSIWRTSLRNMGVETAPGRESSPYLVLLRLVARRPGIEAARLALALEAMDASDEELERILGLADNANWNAVLRRIGASAHMARNATKILPAIAKQIGDLREESGLYYLPEPAAPARNIVGRRPPAPLAGIPRTRHRKVDVNSLATAPSTRQTPPDEEWYADPAVTAELRRQRLVRHQALVRRLGERLSAAGCQLFEDPYDILATRAGECSILGEVKTLDGSLPDEIAQVRCALAQLHYYEHFDVPSDKKPAGLARVAAFEHKPNDEHLAFLESLDIAVVWFEADGAFASGPRSTRLLAGLGLL